MSDSTASPSSSASPSRDDVMADTYAVHVSDGHIDVWQYRVTIDAPDGEWGFVETLDREDRPRLDLEYARPMAPDEDGDGYWIYSKSYDCALDCE